MAHPHAPPPQQHNHHTLPTAPWRNPTHLRTLASQIASAPPSPLPTLLHLTLHSILPFLFFTTFVIAGTIVLAYTLSLGKPVPVRFVIGATGAFAVLVVLGMVVFVWARVRFSGRGFGDEDGDVEARLTDGRQARFVSERDAVEERLTGGARGRGYAPGRPAWKSESYTTTAAAPDPLQRPPTAHIPIPKLGLHSVPQAEDETPRCVSSIEPIPWVENAHPIPAAGLRHPHQQPVRASLRHSHELHAPPSALQPQPQPPRRNPGRADPPHWDHVPREATPQFDRYPRHSSIPPSPSSTRAHIDRAGVPHPRPSDMPGREQDPVPNSGAAKAVDAASGYRGVSQPGSSGAGTPPREPVPVPSLPNKLRKARGLGMGRRRSWGVRRGTGKGEVVLESVEREWPAEVGKGKDVEKGRGIWGGGDVKLAGLGLAEMEGKMQKALLVYHEEGRAVDANRI